MLKDTHKNEGDILQSHLLNAFSLTSTHQRHHLSQNCVVGILMYNCVVGLLSLVSSINHLSTMESLLPTRSFEVTQKPVSTYLKCKICPWHAPHHPIWSVLKTQSSIWIQILKHLVNIHQVFVIEILLNLNIMFRFWKILLLINTLNLVWCLGKQFCVTRCILFRLKQIHIQSSKCSPQKSKNLSTSGDKLHYYLPQVLHVLSPHWHGVSIPHFQCLKKEVPLIQDK